jgi:hypothetical protein
MGGLYAKIGETQKSEGKIEMGYVVSYTLSMRLTLVQLATFVDKWRKMKLTDEDLQALEGLLIENPMAGSVVPGAGGLRKMRFAPPSWHTGKRGGTRIYYAYIVLGEVVYLFTLYGKNEQADISRDEKRVLSQVLARLYEKYRR